MVDGLQQLQGWFYLSLRLAGFHCGADDGDVLPLGRHIVSIGDHAHVDVWRGDKRVKAREKSTQEKMRSEVQFCLVCLHLSANFLSAWGEL